MTNEEYLNQRLGSPRNPFRVPDGYFDSFTENLMEKLPAQSVPLKVQRRPVVRAWMYAAASLVAVVFTFSAYFLFSQDSQATSTTAQTVAPVVADTYVDEAVDYAMVDNHDIYACLTNDY